MSSAPATGPSFNQDSLETQKPKASTYTAVEVSAPNQLRVVERRVAEPGPGQVRIRVEACGICHTDMTTVTGTYPGLTLPRVPGHEVIGRVEALGARPKIDFLKTDPSREAPIWGYPVQCAAFNDGTAPMIGILGSILFPLSSFFSLSSSLYS